MSSDPQPRAGLLRTLDIRGSAARAADSVIPVIQIVCAATLGYLIAHFVLGHAVPLLAVTTTVSILGFARDARPIRVLESAVGITIGIVLSELLLLLIGHGVWQIAVVLFVTLVVARLLSSSNAFAVAAGVQSMIVMLLPPPAGGPFVRSIDGLIGGAMALLVTALVPRDLRRIARSDAKRLFAAFTGALSSLVSALERADEPSAKRALEELRSTQPIVDGWSASLESARAIARISPLQRQRGPDLVAQLRVLRGMDLATRNLRVISRRIQFLVHDGVERPAIASVVANLVTSVRLLGESLDDPLLADTVRVGLVAIAERMRPDTIAKGAPVTDSAVVLMLRPLLVDLLTAAGLSEEKARAILPEI